MSKRVYSGPGMAARLADATKAIFHVRWTAGDELRHGIWGGGNLSAGGSPLVRAFDEFGHVQPVAPDALEIESIASTWDPWPAWLNGRTFSPPRRLHAIEGARMMLDRPRRAEVAPVQLDLFAEVAA